jgi:hypothetical protein
MKLSYTRILAGMMGAGLVTMAIFFTMGGTLTPNKGVIQIDFGMDPKYFEGLEVEIDGEVAGKLQYFGAMSRSGFEVEEGEHEVRVLHPEYTCEPRRVEIEKGDTIFFILDYGSTVSGRGQSETVLTLQR